MIALVEGAARQKTPNEIALNILLASLTIIFLLAVVTLQPLRRLRRAPSSRVVVLVALLVCLIPTTIGALLSAIGIAGMDRLVQRNVLAMSGRAVEAAGDVNTLLLDKTGTITLGNRQAAEFVPVAGRRRRGRSPTRRSCSSLADETPGGPLDRRAGQGGARPARAAPRRAGAREFVPFTAQTRMCGVDLADGGADPQGRGRGRDRSWVRDDGGTVARRGRRDRRRASPPVGRHAAGRRRAAVGDGPGALGVIHLKDVVKDGHARALRRAARAWASAPS